MIYKTIEDILKHYGVKGYKETKEGLIAIRYDKMWIYFRYYDNKNGYMQSGSTDYYKK